MGIGSSSLARTRRRRLLRRAFVVYIALCLATIGWFGQAYLKDRGLLQRLPTFADLPKPAPYYPDCRAAHAAGAYSIRRGEPGYREKLDADLDGLACEPYREDS